MMITNEQQDELSKYLRKNLNYRETYVEFYDHILSALEAKSDALFFQDAVEHIINEDFNGISGMQAIEKKYKKQINKEMQRKYWGYMISYLKFPMIGIITLLASLFYFIALQPWFNLILFISMAFTIRVIPSVLKWIRYFKIGYVFKDTKASVKDDFFIWIDYLPGFICVGALVFSRIDVIETPLVWYKNAGPGIIAFTLSLFALHTLSIYSAYNNEFKMSITDN